MTLPPDVILDLHQDGLRLHINTDSEEVRLTNPVCEQMSVPFHQVSLLCEMPDVARNAIDLRDTFPGHGDVA